jgi:metallo-beta-lactamase family protein
VKLSFHGAARTVTGSCHLLDCCGVRILIDCGLFQGGRELHEDNAGPFGFDASTIDFVLLTHAHLDHVGRLPLLAKQGFRGEVIATVATFDLARLVLLDSAHLQAEEARHRLRAGAGHRQGHDAPPLYTMLETLDAIGRFSRAAAYQKKFVVAPGVSATFFDAGHILGSASILLDVKESGRETSILFSGDIGNRGRPLLRDPQTPATARHVVMESTYGDRQHRDFAASIDEFVDAVASTLGRGGNVVIPTFALERAQDLLFTLHDGVARGRLPKGLPVFLDSPMAISATEIFRRHPECYSAEMRRRLAAGEDPLDLPGLRMTRESLESIEINRIKGGAVIMAGAGMCTGGRIRHHLAGNLPGPANSIVFAGFAAEGTLARRIVDGAQSVRLFGEEIAVRARIHTINGFSAHADQHELVAWHKAIGGTETTFLVHGEEPAMAALQSRLGKGRIERPALGEIFVLE